MNCGRRFSRCCRRLDPPRPREAVRPWKIAPCCGASSLSIAPASPADPADRGLWRQRLELLASLARLDQGGHLARAAPPTARASGASRRAGPAARGGRLPLGPGPQRGAHSSPNVTDRAKKGCKRHVLTDATGVPLVVQTTPANVQDHQQLHALPLALPALAQVPGPGRPRRQPRTLCGDRAYGTAAIVAWVVARGIVSKVAPRSNAPTHDSGLGRHRYVVERTLAWISSFRRIRVCYERWGSHVQAFHDLAACCLVVTRIRHLQTRF